MVANCRSLHLKDHLVLTIGDASRNRRYLAILYKGALPKTWSRHDVGYFAIDMAL